MIFRRLIAPAVVVLLVTGPTAPTALADWSDFQVVVPVERPETEVSPHQLSRIFLQKSTRWEDGSKIKVVDLAKGTEARQRFLRTVHDMDDDDYAKYCIKGVFSGRTKTPQELPDDDAVLLYVAENPSAVGYVSPNAEIPAGVKVLEISDE